MVLSGPFAIWDYSNKLSPPVFLGQVKEELMSSIRGAAESPGLPELPSFPSAVNGACPCSGGGRRAVGTQWCLPGSALHVPLRSLLPRCVLVCFYNKDNSAASCHSSSLSLTGGTQGSLLQLYTTCPLGNKQVQRPLGCTSCCKYPVKMLDLRRKSVVWGFVGGTGAQVISDSLWGLGSITSLPFQPFSIACKTDIKRYLPTSQGCFEI